MESGTVISEQTLVMRAVEGDSSAFGDLYTRYLDAIYRYIYYRVGDNRDAEDLTEMVFLKAWKALPGYRDIGLKFSSWLYRIAHNIVVDFHRKRANDNAYEKHISIEDDLPSNLTIEMNDTEEVSALAQAIARLTQDQQQIIMLRFVEGMGHAEIARIMDRTEGACRMLQNRALVALQEHLKAI